MKKTILFSKYSSFFTPLRYSVFHLQKETRKVRKHLIKKTVKVAHHQGPLTGISCPLCKSRDFPRFTEREDFLFMKCKCIISKKFSRLHKNLNFQFKTIQFKSKLKSSNPNFLSKSKGYCQNAQSPLKESHKYPSCHEKIQPRYQGKGSQHT